RSRLNEQLVVLGEVGAETLVQFLDDLRQRLLWITIQPILLNGILDGLPFERVLQLPREQRQAVQENRHVQALFVLLAELELANDGELVGQVELPGRLVETR